MTDSRHDDQVIADMKALMALALQEPPEVELCSTPDDEELAAFIEGRLESQRRREIIKLLAHDPGIYRRWIEIARTRLELAEKRDETSGES